jgi:glycerophosphoryl diester phosphodiesterase
VDAYMASVGMTGHMIYNLEIKSWPDKDGIFHPAPDIYAGLVLRMVENAGLSDRVRIQSFDYRVVREAWKLNPQLCYGLLIDDMKNMERFLPALGFIPRYLNPHISLVDSELSAYLHAHDIRMIPWTVNRQEEMLAMKHIGAAGIITDYPELALAFFDVQEAPSA